MKANPTFKWLGVVFTSVSLTLATAHAEPDKGTDKKGTGATSEKKADKIDSKADRKTDKIDNQADRKTEKVDDKADRKTDRIDNQADRKIDSLDGKHDNKSDKIETQADRKTDRIDDKADRKTDKIDAKADHKSDKVDDKADAKTDRIDGNGRTDSNNNGRNNNQNVDRKEDRTDRRVYKVGEFKEHFPDRDRDRVVGYFASFSNREHGLPPGFANNWKNVKRLPVGWRDHLVRGYVIDDTWYASFQPVPYTWFPEVVVVPDTRLYWYGDRVVRVYEPTREVVDVIVVPSIHVDL